MARAKKLPIFERYADDGRLLGYRVRIRQQVKGQAPVMIQRQFDKLEDARAFAVAELDRINRGDHYADRKEAETTTLAAALERYEREVTPGKKGAPQEKLRIAAWRRDPMASRVLSSIRGADIAEWRDRRLSAGASPSTVRNDLGVIRHLYTIATKEWGLESLSNPVTKIRMPAPGAARDRRLDPKPGEEDGMTEEARLLAACDSGPHWLGPMVRLALATGMRQGEILGLEWTNINFDRRVARVEKSKNDRTRRDRTKGREVPLSSAAVAALQSLPRNLSGEVIGVGTMAVVHAFQRACKRAGIADLRFHDLRHEATSRLFEKGLNPMEAAAVTGHKTLAMLKRYTHLRAEDLAAKLG